jgi:excisionase family DNA binding protein
MARDAASPFLTTDEAAAYLRIEPRTLANMRHRGTGPHFHKHGGRILYHTHDLDKWSSGTRRRSSGDES